MLRVSGSATRRSQSGSYAVLKAAACGSGAPEGICGSTGRLQLILMGKCLEGSLSSIESHGNVDLPFLPWNVGLADTMASGPL